MMKTKRKIMVFLRRIKWRWLSKEEGCIICWGRTGVLKKTPINEREYYVEGVGQVCNSCWSEDYDDF